MTVIVSDPSRRQECVSVAYAKKASDLAYDISAWEREKMQPRAGMEVGTQGRNFVDLRVNNNIWRSSLQHLRLTFVFLFLLPKERMQNQEVFASTLLSKDKMLSL